MKGIWDFLYMLAHNVCASEGPFLAFVFLDVPLLLTITMLVGDV